MSKNNLVYRCECGREYVNAQDAAMCGENFALVESRNYKMTKKINDIENKIRDSIRDNSGGHGLRNLSGDKLWQTREPINLTELAKVIFKEVDNEI